MKPIKISQDLKQSLLEKFTKYLEDARMSDNKIDFSARLFDNENETPIIKPIVLLTPEAYLKIWKLVSDTDTEIGWHGLVTKTDNTYIIEDIILYPQTVTGSTVTTDDTEYTTWLMEIPDDKFEKMRFQGHSHVNFGTTPSGVDNQFYDAILQNMQEGDYYIFMIMNKKHDINIWIYDYAQNTIFEKTDITLKCVLSDFSDLKSWAEDSKMKYVKHITPTLVDFNREFNKNRYSSNNSFLADDDGYTYSKSLDRLPAPNVGSEDLKKDKRSKKKDHELYLDGRRIQI